MFATDDETTVVSCQRNGVHCARTLRREAAGIRIDDDDYGGAAAVAVESIKSQAASEKTSNFSSSHVPSNL